ncbi:MAG TPA: hypothetical protein PK040_06925 [Anaerolineaceae bacterium]|nr:hypothetical protein [Anaerolineaceae bacterium]
MAKKKTQELINPAAESAAETQPVSIPVETQVNSTGDQAEAVLGAVVPAGDQAELPGMGSTLIENGKKASRKPGHRSGWIWLGILGMLVIVGIGAGIGYASAINARTKADEDRRLNAAVVQFEQALQDQAAGNYGIAQQRYQYVLSIYPQYPGLDEKLVEIGLLVAQNGGGFAPVTTPQAGVTPGTPSKPAGGANTQNLNALNRQAQTYLKAQDWVNLYATAAKMRDINPNFNAVKVDGYHYMALRNLGMSKILAGNLEVGSYYFSLAEQIGPIDNEAQNLNRWAQLYLTAGSWWGINWQNAIMNFSELYTIAPNLIDSSHFSVTQRFAGAYEGYGRFLQQNYQWCDAVNQFQYAANINPSERLNAVIEDAAKLCANPPPMPTPTLDPNAPTPQPTKKPKKN